MRTELIWIWILASSYQQYLYYYDKFKRISVENGLDIDFHYLNEPYKLRGYRNGLFIRVGNWYDIQRHELDKIMILLKHLNFKEIEYDDKEEEERRLYYYNEYKELDFKTEYENEYFGTWNFERRKYRDLLKSAYIAEPPREEFIKEEEMTL